MTAAALLLVPLGAVPPSEVIFPEQRIPLSFSHRQHLAIKGVTCDYCHETAGGSRVARDMLIPGEELCAECHAIDRARPDKQARPVAACIGCHPGWKGPTPQAPEPPRVQVPVPNLRFNHRVHTTGGIKCVQCHAQVPERDLATRADLPRMPLCLTCHDGRQAPSRCTTCHVADAEGRVRTVYPQGKLLPSGVLRGDDHREPSFKTDHERIARNDARYCESCHRQDECAACHDGVVRPLSIHGNNYVLLHAADARKNTPDCSSCHRLQSFCIGCHARSGVQRRSDQRGLPGAPDDAYNAHFDRARGVRFHPEGWADEDARGPNHHAVQAQRNIRACVSCHREDTCFECHQTMDLGGKAFSPHPAHFAFSRLCDSLAAKNPRACLKCHAVDDPRRRCR